MPAIKHILFPTDFSERCRGAAPFVQAMASRFGAKLTLLSVVQPYWYAGIPEAGTPVIVDTDELKRSLEAGLSQAFVDEFAALPVERIADVGDPADTITRFAHSHGVNLIMMPTHGYGTFRRLLLGSVTAKVLHDVHCPVWTGAHMQEPPVLDHLACRSILCAVDETPKSAALMEWAAQFAKDSGATLRLVHAFPAPEAWPERQLNTEFAETLRQELRVSIEKIQKSVGVEAPLCVVAGDVADAVREEAERHATDLIVIGRGSIHEKLGRLRTNAYGIIRQAPCPVLSV
jgi:nucleotide-binding universal stress UspA family protein